MNKHSFIAGLSIVSILTLASCSSYDTVNLNKQQSDESYPSFKMEPPLYQGDVVRYRLKNGLRKTISVSKTSSQDITTNTGSIIPLKDVVTLEKKDISKGKTAAAVVGGIGVTAVVIGAILLVGFSAGFAAVLSGS